MSQIRAQPPHCSHRSTLPPALSFGAHDGQEGAEEQTGLLRHSRGSGPTKRVARRAGDPIECRPAAAHSVELGQWKQANPELARDCRQAAEALSQVQVEFLGTMTREIAEIQCADGRRIHAQRIRRSLRPTPGASERRVADFGATFEHAESDELLAASANVSLLCSERLREAVPNELPHRRSRWALVMPYVAVFSFLCLLFWLAPSPQPLALHCSSTLSKSRLPTACDCTVAGAAARPLAQWRSIRPLTSGCVCTARAAISIRRRPWPALRRVDRGRAAALRANARGHDLVCTGPSAMVACGRGRRSNASRKRPWISPPGSPCSAKADFRGLAFWDTVWAHQGHLHAGCIGCAAGRGTRGRVAAASVIRLFLHHAAGRRFSPHARRGSARRCGPARRIDEGDVSAAVLCDRRRLRRPLRPGRGAMTC